MNSRQHRGSKPPQRHRTTKRSTLTPVATRPPKSPRSSGTSIASTPAWSARRRTRPRRRRPATASRTSGTSVRWSSATRWSSMPPGGAGCWTRSTRASCSAGSICTVRRLDTSAGSACATTRLGALVIDWRAPAAAPFYRATPTDPMKVIRRRTIASNGERVTSIEDDLLDPDAAPPDMRVIGDGALVASLARTTGTGMRDIVSTIQREQDDAIRSPASGVTFVRGGPGTGKTAVALHRAAYLLYSDRQRFAGGGVLVVGPSPVFVTYISRVLPSLGEDEVTLASLGSMVDGIVASRHDDSAVATVKGSARMARLLARAARGRRRTRRPSCACSIAARCSASAVASWTGCATPCSGSDRRATVCAARPPATCWMRCGSRRATSSGPAGRRRAKTLPNRWPSGASSSCSCADSGRCCGRSTCSAGSAIRTGCATTPTGCSIAARWRLLAGARPRRRREANQGLGRGCRVARRARTTCSGSRHGHRGSRAIRTRSAAYGRSPRTPTARRPPAGPWTGRPTIATTPTSSSTRRRTSRRCSGG